MNRTDEVIIDLDKYEMRYYQESKDFAEDVIYQMHNFSTGLQDVTLENFRVPERIIRWHERVLANGDFEKGLRYIGQFFQTLWKLNYEVFLEPSINPYTSEIDYIYRKAFDLDKIHKHLYEMNLASLQIDLKFIDMYGFIPNSFCKRSIRYHQKRIYKAFGHLMDFVDALRKSRPAVDKDGNQSDPYDDYEVAR